MRYDDLKSHLMGKQHVWLVTGVAGFIGSNLMQALLELNQKVIGLDNLATGYKKNIDDVLAIVDPAKHKNFTFIKGDIRSIDDCREAMKGVDYVLHQAALGSVPRSIKSPELVNAVNVDGFVNMLIAAKDAKVKNFVYASSSSVYGDSPILPKVETHAGNPLSPYAVTKMANELYAKSFSTCYDINTIGLRYFNVFGARQDPKGAYAAVIPLWIATMLNGGEVVVNGDGKTTRDFCYIDNVVQANLLAAVTSNDNAMNQVYNVAVGDQTSLNQLFQMIRESLKVSVDVKPTYKEFREGDILHSLADIAKAKTLLGYEPEYKIVEGLQKAMAWYRKSLV